MTFNELRLIEPLLKALATEGYTNPTPIQEQAIPIVLQKRDLLGCAQTGTGKTAAFALPILQLMHERHAERKHRDIQTLVLTPTRELAIQIGDSFAAYGRNLGLKHTVIFGGVPQGAQVQALKNGVETLIATPGRLLDLMSQGYVHLDKISIFVLDEADRMLDMGFIHDVKKVVAKLPQQRQTLFFSATMPPEIQKLANTILVNPEKVEVTPVSSTAETIQQTVYFVDKKDKRGMLAWVLQDAKIDRVLVFTRTKHGADKVVKDLQKINIKAEAIHGNKSQNARQRALGNFKDGNIRVLVATDIAARGIDVDSLSHVINYEIPEVPETYVHRIGRTGRAGLSGTAMSFCDADERADWRNIEKLTGIKIPEVKGHPFPMAEEGLVKINLPKNKDIVLPANAVVNAMRGHGGNRHKQQQKPAQKQQSGEQQTAQPKPGHKPQNEQKREPRPEQAARPSGGNQQGQAQKPAQSPKQQAPAPARKHEQHHKTLDQKEHPKHEHRQRSSSWDDDMKW